MEVISTIDNSKSIPRLIIGYDISKFKHNFYSTFSSVKQNHKIEGVVGSSRKELNSHFTNLREQANNYGFDIVEVVCEPTGGYEKTFINLARVHGFEVKYVSGEATSKYKVIETNDSGKNDIKDARIIFSLASQGKTLVCRELKGVYANLSQVNRNYERISLEKATSKNMFSSIVDQFFPDLGIKSSKLYNKVLSCIIKEFRLNPYEIAKLSLSEFEGVIQESYKRKFSKHQKSIISLVWNNAESYKGVEVTSFYLKESERSILHYYGHIESLEQLKVMYRERLIELYTETDEYKKLNEFPVSDFLMARVISETGPLSDFNCIQKLMRYAGLNLKECSSGTHVGKVKISKKGNILLRKILGQVSFSSFTKKGTDMGEIYHKKKASKGGYYAMTCMMRKGLKMIFGVYKTKAVFKLERMFDQTITVETIAA